MPLAFHHYLGTYLLENELTYLHIQDDQKPWYGSQMFLLFHLLIKKCLKDEAAFQIIQSLRYPSFIERIVNMVVYHAGPMATSVNS